MPIQYNVILRLSLTPLKLWLREWLEPHRKDTFNKTRSITTKLREPSRRTIRIINGFPNWWLEWKPLFGTRIWRRKSLRIWRWNHWWRWKILIRPLRERTHWGYCRNGKLRWKCLWWWRLTQKWVSSNQRLKRTQN